MDLSLLFLVLIITVFNLCMLICVLKTCDNNTDLILDIERELRRLRKVLRK